MNNVGQLLRRGQLERGVLARGTLARGSMVRYRAEAVTDGVGVDIVGEADADGVLFDGATNPAAGITCGTVVDALSAGVSIEAVADGVLYDGATNPTAGVTVDATGETVTTESE